MADEREFYDARPAFETLPEDDPPMTVRVESWERRRDPSARRAIKTDSTTLGLSWLCITGLDEESASWWMDDAEVHNWPVSHPLDYSVAFRHAETRKALEEAARAPRGVLLVGDMGEEAFRGAPD